MPQRYFDADEAKQLQCMVDLGGSAATIVRDEGVTPIDAAKPWLGNTPSEVSYAGIAILTKVTAQYLEEEIVQATDKMAYFSPRSITIEPTIDDFFEQGGVRYSIVMAHPVKPGAIDLLWRLIIRR